MTVKTVVKTVGGSSAHRGDHAAATIEQGNDATEGTCKSVLIALHGDLQGHPWGHHGAPQ